MPVLNDADRIYNGSSLAARVYAGTNRVWPKVLAPTFDAPLWGTVIGEYDFGDTARITSSAGAVSAVAPKTGTAGPITQGTAANRPTTGIRTGPSGRNALDFGPAMGPKRLAVNAPSYTPAPTTVVFVAQNDVPATFGPQMFGDNPAIYTGNSSGSKWFLYSASGVPTTVPVDGLWHVFACVFNAASSQLWLDGTLRATVNPGGSDTTALVVGNYGGGGYGFDGGIGHAIWYRGIVADIPGMSASLKALHGTP